MAESESSRRAAVSIGHKGTDRFERTPAAEQTNTKTREVPRVDDPRDEVRSPMPRVETETPEPELQQPTPDRAPKDVAADTQTGQSQPATRAKKRSTTQSAAIIAGVAAAGAAIGGVTGGSKGAVIGAITGGAGGYVYDRMTRRRDISNTTPGSSPLSDDNQAYDRAPLAHRFGTPGFTGSLN
jgi:hypothetical protein